MVQSNMTWDGEISLFIVDSHHIDKMGLANHSQALFDAIKSGELPVKRTIKQKNKATNYARQYIVDMLTGNVSYPLQTPTQMELGTGTGTPAQTDTGLWSPSVGTMKLCSGVQPYLTYYAQYVTTWQSSDPIQGNWSEIGLFDANNNLWAHATLNSKVAINANENLVAQWAIQILAN